MIAGVSLSNAKNVDHVNVVAATARLPLSIGWLGSPSAKAGAGRACCRHARALQEGLGAVQLSGPPPFVSQGKQKAGPTNPRAAYEAVAAASSLEREDFQSSM
jgi:hypothetical protein